MFRMDNDRFYVGINEPNEVRKDLLGCSKDIISILRHYDRINSIRAEKIENIMKLKGIVREIRRLNLRLKEKLPTEEIRAKKVKANVRKKSVKKAGSGKKANKKASTQIKRLEDELNEIESRLSNLS